MSASVVETTPEKTSKPHVSTTIGQKYMKAVVQSWRIIRHRNLINAKRAKHLEAQFLKYTQKLQFILKQYSRFELEMKKISQIQAATEKVKDDLAELFDHCNQLEIIRSKLILSKNTFLLESYRAQQENDLLAHEELCKNDITQRHNDIEKKRQSLIEDAITSHKKLLQEEYEKELKKFVSTTLSKQLNSAHNNNVNDNNTNIHIESPVKKSSSSISIQTALGGINTPIITPHNKINDKTLLIKGKNNNTSTTAPIDKPAMSLIGFENYRPTSATCPHDDRNGNKPNNKKKSAEEILDMFLDPSNLPQLDDLP